MYVNNEPLTNSEAPRALKNLTTILISKVKIIFLLPNEKSEQRFEISKQLLDQHLPEKAEEHYTVTSTYTKGQS